MNKEIKDKWIAALRSGKYKQGNGKLRSLTDDYCCLGVLCDVIGCEWKKDDGDYLYGAHYKNGIAYAIPTEDIDKDVEFPVLGWGKLIEMNDRFGYSFNAIADWIEANL